MSTTTSTRQTEGLRAAADFIDAHPDLPKPYITAFTSKEHVELNYYLHINGFGDLAEQKATAVAIVRAVGGTWEKEAWGDDFRFAADLGPLRFDVRVKREAVCERIVTGTETITLPAVEAQPERTEEREVVEWRCEPLLAEATA